MGFHGEENDTDLLNRWEDDSTHTLQAYVCKLPLLSDGARTGGTMSVVTGTSGTKTGTVNFTPQANYFYNLHTLSSSLVQSGTFGTIAVTNILLNGEPLGTLGDISNFATLYGDDLTLHSSLGFVYSVETGTGVVGTFGVTVEVSGWKAKSIE